MLQIIKTFAVYCSTQADGLISSAVDYVITFNYHTFLITFKIDLHELMIILRLIPWLSFYRNA